ncbi:MAG: hypothetical protein ACOX5A_12075 [Aminivibrio sp.]|jgi:hypothetical protein
MKKKILLAGGLALLISFAVALTPASLLWAEEEGDGAVKGLWVEVGGLPENVVDLDFQMNDEGVASYTRMIDDGTAILVVERLPVENDEGETVTAENLAALIASFEGIEEKGVNVTSDMENFSKLYSYPVCGADYVTGDNEDARDNVDLFIFTDSWLFRIHIAISADFSEEYEEMAGEWLTNLKLVER